MGLSSTNRPSLNSPTLTSGLRWVFSNGKDTEKSKILTQSSFGFSFCFKLLKGNSLRKVKDRNGKGVWLSFFF